MKTIQSSSILKGESNVLEFKYTYEKQETEIEVINK